MSTHDLRRYGGSASSLGTAMTRRTEGCCFPADPRPGGASAMVRHVPGHRRPDGRHAHAAGPAIGTLLQRPPRRRGRDGGERPHHPDPPCSRPTAKAVLANRPWSGSQTPGATLAPVSGSVAGTMVCGAAIPLDGTRTTHELPPHDGWNRCADPVDMLSSLFDQLRWLSDAGHATFSGVKP